MKFKLLLNDNAVLNIEKNLVIPKGNPLYSEYEEWLIQGNTPQPIFSLEELKKNKINELKRECEKTIQNGFKSSALGSEYNYDSDKSRDRENLMGAKLANVDMNYACTDQQGIKKQRLHTAEQISMVFNDAVLHVQNNTYKFYQKIDEIELATTEQEIYSIVWD